MHYEPRARAWTHVPQTLKGYLKQQVRWNKSFYREIIWTIQMIIEDPRKLHPYIIYDIVIQTILPFLLLFSLGFAFYRGLFESPLYILGYVMVLVGIALIRCMYGYYRTNDYHLLRFPMYAFLHIFFLIPVRIYALLTLKTTHWGTR